MGIGLIKGINILAVKRRVSWIGFIYSFVIWVGLWFFLVLLWLGDIYGGLDVFDLDY